MAVLLKLAHGTAPISISASCGLAFAANAEEHAEPGQRRKAALAGRDVQQCHLAAAGQVLLNVRWSAGSTREVENDNHLGKQLQLHNHSSFPCVLGLKLLERSLHHLSDLLGSDGDLLLLVALLHQLLEALEPANDGDKRNKDTT